MRWPLEMRCKAMVDAEKLKSMKREEVQALAKELGVNAGGKTEEIIARIQAAQGVQEGQGAAAGQEGTGEAAQGVGRRIGGEANSELFFRHLSH